MGDYVMTPTTSVVAFLLAVSFLLTVPTLSVADVAGKKAWSGRVRGEVIKIEGDVYTVEDDLGRRLKLHVLPTAEKDVDVRVGDEILARTTHRAKEVYIKSLKKISSSSSPSLFVEGRVVKIEGDSYLVKDISGREVRLHVDDRTSKDGNITIGDTVQARIDGGSAAHAETLGKR
jgi:hypothetical protein